jgi:hypothetical protein
MVPANTAKSLYTPGQATTRNPDFWLKDVDFTCCAANLISYNSTLISPRHLIWSAHAGTARTAVSFVTNDNQVITRNVVNEIYHPYFQPYFPDIGVSILDADVPDTIKFAKVLPKNWPTYFPITVGDYGLNTVGRVGAIGFTQDRYATARDWRYVVRNNITIPNVPNPYSLSFSAPIGALKNSLYQDVRGGDSSSPAFIIINNEPVLLTTWTYGGGGAGTSIAEQADYINAMMTTLGGGYQLTTVDLTIKMTLKSQVYQNSQVLSQKLPRPSRSV